MTPADTEPLRERNSLKAAGGGDSRQMVPGRRRSCPISAGTRCASAVATFIDYRRVGCQPMKTDRVAFNTVSLDAA